MSEQKKPHRPIGYWLKKADEVITARIDQVQEANGLSRTDWQMLNVLHEVTSATWEQLAEPLRPFADTGPLRVVIDQLVRRGLLEREGSPASGFRLTDQGRRVHEAALTLQKEVRQQALQGVSEADYATTVRVLQRFVENLSGGDAAQHGVATDGAAPRR